MTKDPHYQREADKYERPVASREYLLELINQQKAPTSLEHLIELLGYSDENDIEGLRRRLKAMVRDGQVFRNRRGGFLGFGKKIGKDEQMALAGIMVCLGLNLG